MNDTRVAELRHAFDRGFAEEPARGRESGTDLLLVGLGGLHYALRVSETLALARDRKIVPVPSTMVGLVGLCGFRGDTIAVFSLAGLLGHPVGPTPWVAVCGRRAEPIGLAFDSLEGYASASASQLHPLTDATNPHLSSTVTVPNGIRAIVDVESLSKLIERRETELRRSKEP